MMRRIVITPIILEGETRVAQALRIVDPGRNAVDPDTGLPAVKYVTGRLWSRNGLSWGICDVQGVDLSGLDAVPEIVVLHDLLDGSPMTTTLGQLTVAKRTRLRNAAVNAGITTNYPNSTLVIRVLRDIGRIAEDSFDLTG